MLPTSNYNYRLPASNVFTISKLTKRPYSSLHCLFIQTESFIYPYIPEPISQVILGKVYKPANYFVGVGEVLLFSQNTRNCLCYKHLVQAVDICHWSRDKRLLVYAHPL